MTLSLRDDCDATQLDLTARRSGNACQVLRLLALTAIYNGACRAEAARTVGVTRKIVRDWVERFNDGEADALIADKALGKPPLPNPAQRAQGGYPRHGGY